MGVSRQPLTRDGRIISGEDLEVATLEDAATEALRLLAASIDEADGQPDGIEIWQGASLLYEAEKPADTDAFRHKAAFERDLAERR